MHPDRCTLIGFPPVGTIIGSLTMRVISQIMDWNLELWSLDRQTYLYYNTLGDLMYSNPIFGSTPSNPVTNLSNGALGYFGSYSVTSRQITITEDLINSIK